MNLLPIKIERLLTELRTRGLSVGFAESCTGGLLSATLARVPGVSDVFRGAVVSYANEVKQDLLDVSAETLRAHGAVSEEVAREMARGACDRLHVDCAAAITGIAGPSGGSPQKPVGTVWFAARGPGFEVSQRQQFAGDRAAIQNQAVEFAIELLTQELLKK